MKTLIMSIACSFVLLIGTSFSGPKRTLKNLQDAYETEANSARRYELYSVRADKEGYGQVAKLFRAASESKTVLMNNHKKLLLDRGIQPKAITYDRIKVKDTRKNLKKAVAEEGSGYVCQYPNLIQEARKDGKEDVKLSFEFAKSAADEQWTLFQNALDDLGKNPDQAYFLNDFTGEVLSVDANQTRSVAGEDMVRIN